MNSFSNFTKMNRNILIKNEFLTSLYVVTVALLLALLITEQNGVDPNNPLHQTSSVAYGQLVFWIFIISSNIFLFFKFNFYGFQKVTSLFLTNLIALTAGISTGSIALSLDGFVQYFGLLQGDLGVHLQMAQNAYNSGWESSGYPPLFPTIVGNLAHVFEFNSDFQHQVTSAHKFLSIYSIPVWAALLLILYKLAFPPILAEFLALFTVLSITIDGWKIMGEAGTQLMLLILLKRIYEIYQGKQITKYGSRFVNLFMGLTFGLFITLYFGRLWWASFAIAIGIFTTNFIRVNRDKIQVTLIDFFLGAALPLTPMLMASKYAELKIGLRISHVLVLVIIFIIFWLRINFNSKITSLVASIVTSFISILIFLAVFNFEINDTYLYEGVYGNVASLIDFSGTSAFVAISLLLVMAVGGLKENRILIAQMILAISILFSAILLRLYFAFEMMYTNKVELWPRSGTTINDNIQLVFFILIYFAAVNINNKFKLTQVNNLNLTTEFNLKFIWMILVVIVSLYVSKSTGSIHWGMLNT